MRASSILVALTLVLVFLILAAVGCNSMVADKGEAIRALQAQGFHNIRITGGSPFPTIAGCGNDDSYAFKAEATNITGQRVTGITICEGLLKKATIRY